MPSARLATRVTRVTVTTTTTTTSTSPLQRSVMRSRGELLRVQSGAERQLADAYHRARGSLSAQLAVVVDGYRDELKRRQQAQAAGDESATLRVPQSWLHSPQGGNWPHVAASVTSEMRAFGRTAYGITEAAKGDAVDVGSAGAQEALVAAVAPIAHALPNGGRTLFKQPNDAAVRAFVQRAKDGGPLLRVFDGFGPDESEALYSTLAAGLAAGVNPNTLAGELSRTLDTLSYGRAATIARTETLHAWQSAALENYRANRDVVSSWQWMAEKGPNTCAGCLAMDGTIHDLDEDLDDHPNGRCAKAPVTKGYAAILADFGIDASDVDFGDPPWQTYQSGSDWLHEQPAATQRSVFGSTAAYLAYSAGDAVLGDFAGVRRDAVWGDSIYQQSLKSIGLDASDYTE